MSTFDTFKQLVEELEKGRHPAHFPDRAAAIKALEDEICVSPWQSVEEREKAQGLVARLERMKWAKKPPDCISDSPAAS